MYGLECSSIADMAKRIVSDNGYADRVTIIKGKVSSHTLFCLGPPLLTWEPYVRQELWLLSRAQAMQHAQLVVRT